MSDTSPFLAAISASPEDDAPRLVFADWLDEHGDPELAEFIRLQVELDPLERSPRNDLADWQRAVVRRRQGDSIPAEFPAPMQRFAKLVRREQELLEANKLKWLGSVASMEDDFTAHFQATFRRGFVDEVAMCTSVFLWYSEQARDRFPLLRKVTLYGPRDQGPDFAACPALGGIRELVLAGWITPYDARFLATSFELDALESLKVWIGSETDEEMIETLATPAWDDDGRQPTTRRRPFAKLKELELVQMYGGVQAGPEGESFDQRAVDLAMAFDRRFGRKVALVERPFDRRFVLNGRIGYGMVAGTSGAKFVLLNVADEANVYQFNLTNGRLREIETRPLDRLPPSNNREHTIVERLRDEHGFEPGPIFIRPFQSDTGDQLEFSVYPFGQYSDVLADPDLVEGEELEEACAVLAEWMAAGHFVIDNGIEHWAGPDGIFSS